MTKETSALKQSDEFEPDESCPEITMRRKLIAARQQEKSLATKAFSLVDALARDFNAELPNRSSRAMSQLIDVLEEYEHLESEILPGVSKRKFLVPMIASFIAGAVTVAGIVAWVW
ncbi:hypothetical protein DYI22_12645 [Marinobacter lipolyticus]|uniref:hypothetical protein n=1 Tax=Marinobacter lipolyticus TaxID=209639 RepID=UPI001BCFB0B0|nr:hypothetical protein [Marinobacter lipolyticus]MBS8241345.1 hypothetical protein [Marinobacter lipolyticus]